MDVTNVSYEMNAPRVQLHTVERGVRTTSTEGDDAMADNEVRTDLVLVHSEATATIGARRSVGVAK